MLVRRFLWVITAIVLLVVAGALAFRLFAPAMMRIAFVPTVRFEDDRQTPGPDYRDPAMWIARPDIAGNPALWTPPGTLPGPTGSRRAAVFFVHPTSYLDRAHWNAPLDDAESRQRAALFVQSEASAFNEVGDIWAPRYRQATLGALLTNKGDGDLAIEFAYRDILAAFDEFLKEVATDRPIILAGHSQGSYHLSRLMIERVAGKPLARRIVAAYVVGWPLSQTVDLPGLGFPACRTNTDAGCVLSWLSYAKPADPRQFMDLYDASSGPNGQSRAGTPLLCVNPLTGNTDDAATAASNHGTLIPDAELRSAELQPGLVPARCDDHGLLLIGNNPPKMPPFVLPGNNYHVFDYVLFWANIREDAARRLASFEGQ